MKKMRKGTLAKMDEVKHVLVERDILTAVKTPWLVRLLYAFQDNEHVYLAMVSLFHLHDPTPNDQVRADGRKTGICPRR